MVTMDAQEMISKVVSSKDLKRVHSEFEEKLERVADAGNLQVANVAVRVWEYFTSPSVSSQAKLLAGAALLYFIIPIDIIPDIQPMFGYVDDMIVLQYALSKGLLGAGQLQSARSKFRELYLGEEGKKGKKRKSKGKKNK